MASLPRLQPSSIDERIRKACECPKTNAILRYLPRASYSGGIVVLGSKVVGDDFYGCTSVNTKISAYGATVGDDFYLAQSGITKELKAYARIWSGDGSECRGMIYKFPNVDLGTAQLIGCSNIISMTTAWAWRTFTFPSPLSLTAGRYLLAVGCVAGYAQLRGRPRSAYFISPNGEDMCRNPYGSYGAPWTDVESAIYCEVEI